MRISVTDLDGWKFYRESNLSIKEYVLRLQRRSVPTAAMKMGIEFHKMMEFYSGLRSKDKMDFLKREFIFHADVQVPQPDAVEVKNGFDVDGEIRVSGRIDWIGGTTVGDWKTTSLPIDLEKYADAWQWKTYLTMFDYATDFRYDVFRIGQGSSLALHTIDEHRFINLSRYPGMEEEVKTEVRNYVAFLRQLERDGYIDIVDGRVNQFYPVSGQEIIRELSGNVKYDRSDRTRNPF